MIGLTLPVFPLLKSRSSALNNSSQKNSMPIRLRGILRIRAQKILSIWCCLSIEHECHRKNYMILQRQYSHDETTLPFPLNFKIRLKIGQPGTNGWQRNAELLETLEKRLRSYVGTVLNLAWLNLEYYGNECFFCQSFASSRILDIKTNNLTRSVRSPSSLESIIGAISLYGSEMAFFV